MGTTTGVHSSARRSAVAGPKGYERSDERLREVICERLTVDPDIDASDITVDVRNHAVTLRGLVDDLFRLHGSAGALHGTHSLGTRGDRGLVRSGRAACVNGS
jgi:osmotically-inducible protein OsmY